MIDHRSDIYALGVIIYEMLTGRAPYEGQGVMDILALKVRTDYRPVPMKDFVAEVSESLEAVVMRAMSHNQNERPQSMAEFDELLAAEKFETRQDVPAVPERQSSTDLRSSEHRQDHSTSESQPSREWQYEPPERPRPSERRVPWILAGLALAVTGLVIGTFVFLSRSSEEFESPREEPPMTPNAAVSLPSRDAGSDAASAQTAEPAPPAKRRGFETASPSDDAEHLIREGWAHLRSGRLAEAKRSFQAAARLEDRRATEGLATVAYQEGRYEEAAALARRAGATLLLAHSHLRMRQCAEAAAAYERVLKRNSANREAQSGLAAARRCSP